MAWNWTIFTRTTPRAIFLRRKFYSLTKTAILPSRHDLTKYTRSLNNSRNYFLAFLNQDNDDNGVFLEGPILPSFGFDSSFGLAFYLALAAKFLAFSEVFLAADLVAVLALEAVALAFAGAFLTAAFAFAGAALAAFFAAVAVFFVA